jgi:uncharacterized protein (DUF885 family)
MMRTLILGLSAVLVSCPAIAQQKPTSPAARAVVVRQNAELAAFFDDYDKAQLKLSPIWKTVRGIVDEDYGRWNDFTDEGAQRRQSLDQTTLAALHARFDRDRLSLADQLSYELFEDAAARNAAAFAYRRNAYVFDQMNGSQSQLPAILINLHRVNDVASAEAYVSRLAGLGSALDQLMAEANLRAAQGVQPPRWVYPYVIRDAENLIAGAPFDDGADSTLFADLKKKVGALTIPDNEKARLVESGRKALLADVGPAYRRLIALMRRHEIRSGGEDGVGRLANGKDYYAERLRYYTTTRLSADEIHAIGLREVTRIHGEMRGIMQRVSFNGSLQDFFEHARTDPRFFYATRADYLADVQARKAAMERVLPRYFATIPKDPMVVKEVEPFREKSASKAFYQLPAPDGSRPGTYYVNLYDLKAMSKNEVEALFYHEGLPGHHLQRSIQVGLGDLPAFRRFGLYNAYSEGWGLYAERLGKDMGFYSDPYSDLGRLSMEILRAGRLVVDTGIHHKGWSREQAVAWFKANTPVTEGDIQNQVERYVVYPGQATSYTVGKLKIEALRARSEAALGRRFDIRAFHDVVLQSGPVPLDTLERNVGRWIEERTRQ